MDNKEGSSRVRKNRKYSELLKKKVAFEYMDGLYTARQLGERYGIANQRVFEWVAKYCANIAKEKLTILSPMTSEEQKEFEALKHQVAALKKKLEYSELKAEAYGIMVDLAKEELGIDILKKLWCQTAEEIKRRHARLGMGHICGLFGRTRQAWYKQQANIDDTILRDSIIIRHVKEIREQMPRIGTRKLHYLLEPVLAQHGIETGRDKLFDILASYGLLVRRRKRKKMFTTDSSHFFKKYPNLIKDMEIMRPDQLWVSDITYISLKDEFCYLSLITDAYSRKIIGYGLWPTLKKEGPLNALRMALDSRYEPGVELVHHSDRGLQYCCHEYTETLNRRGIFISMTEKGDPYENALAERVNGILKTEFGLEQKFSSYEQAVERGRAGGICLQ